MNLIEKLSEFCNKDLSTNLRAKKPISAGPWGSNEGADWRFNVEGRATITGIGINYGKIIDSITIHYELDGVSDHAKFGGVDLDWQKAYDDFKETGLDWPKVYGDFKEFVLDWPKEYLTSIKGSFSTYGGKLRLRGLRFVINVQEYGPYGPESVGRNLTYFELPLEGGMIVRFHGQMDRYLNSIGVYMKPS